VVRLVARPAASASSAASSHRCPPVPAQLGESLGHLDPHFVVLVPNRAAAGINRRCELSGSQAKIQQLAGRPQRVALRRGSLRPENRVADLHQVFLKLLPILGVAPPELIPVTEDVAEGRLLLTQQ
jgi:hypothetical protein